MICDECNKQKYKCECCGEDIFPTKKKQKEYIPLDSKGRPWKYYPCEYPESNAKYYRNLDGTLTTIPKD